MRRTGLLSTITFLLALAPGVALAGASIAGGLAVTSQPSSTGGMAILSSGPSIPLLPIDFQGSLAVPITKNGGFALTAEMRGFTGGGFGGAYFGGGVGIGTIGTTRTMGPVFTVFAGKSIAPFTSLEIRLYQATRDGGSTIGFVGLRFGL